MPATTVGSAADDPGDIVATVARHVPLAPHGEHQLCGRCPFCESPAPALVVRPRHGTFHCLRCGEGGGSRGFAVKISRR